MTLIERFPDVSMLIREKKKLDMKDRSAELFDGIQYNPLTLDQKFYDKEFRMWHYKLVVSLGVLLTALFYLVLNSKSIYDWIAS